MTTQPTNNPVPSESPRDLKFNAGKIDEFVTSLALKYQDRFGGDHYTIEGLRYLAQEAISNYGWIFKDSFEDGATLTLPNEALLLRSSGEYYRWSGVFPKTISAGSTPENTGGIGQGAWIGIGDAALKTMLASSSGASMIGMAAGGTLDQIINYVTAEQFGALADGISDDAIAINAALDYMGKTYGGGVVKLFPRQYTIKTTIKVPSNCTLSGSTTKATKIKCHASMPRELNGITNKRNPLPLFGSKNPGVEGVDFNYDENIVIENISLNANHLERDPNRLTLVTLTSVQACGIKLASVRNSRVSNCHVEYALLHAYDVAGWTYFSDGDYTHNLNGGSENVIVENCTGKNSLYDDIFTCHGSNAITFRDCRCWNDGADPQMIWENNQNGFEIDEGCDQVLVENCYAEYFMAGFQAKGHDVTMPARSVTFRSCYAKRCAWSFQLDHYSTYNSTSNILAKNIIIEGCTSENAYNDRYQSGDAVFRARAIWLRSYYGVSVRDFTIIGGQGQIDIERGASSIVIDGLIFKGSFNGMYKDSNAGGLISILSNGSRGRLTFKNINVLDPLSVPVIRCVDALINKGITIDGLYAIGSNNSIPCVFMTLNTASNVRDLQSSGFSAALQDSSAVTPWSLYSNNLNFSIEGGLATIRGVGVPDGATSPARIGNRYINLSTGKIYGAVGSGVNSVGTWTIAGAMTSN